MTRAAPASAQPRIVALAETLVVAGIWASSFVFVKIALGSMGPLTVAGLRYSLAFVVLVPFLTANARAHRPLTARGWLRLAAIGLSAYTLGNGALFWGLKYLPATTGSFLMSLVPLVVLFAGALWLKEIPTRRQVLGVVVSLAGSALFFSAGLQSGEPLGVAIVAVGLAGFALFGVLGRAVARDREVGTLTLTALPLAAGGGLLLLIALPLEGWPGFDLQAWLIIVWLAVVNTAFAYFVYNHALQVLTALEVNMVLNLSPLLTAAWAWLFLGETMTPAKIAGMVTVIVGVVLVQARGR